MNSKERVLTAINHGVPDKLPLALWGGPYGIVDELYFKLLDVLQLSPNQTPFRSGHTINYMDDRILEYLGTDFRYVWPGASPSSPYIVTEDPDVFLDSFNQPWKRTYPYFSATTGILAKANCIQDIDLIVNWPDIADQKWVNGVKDRVTELKETDYFIAGRMVVSHGPLQMASDLRGMDNFMVDMVDQPDFAQALLERVTDLICGLTKTYINETAGRLNMIELPGDDYGSNTGLIISPKMFKTYIKPCIKRIIDVIKTIQPEIKIMFHSDGAITKIIPDLIELGVDVIHPLEPVVGMDIPFIKKEYGNQVSFLGGIDISHAMTGSIKDVQAEVDRCINELAPAGGYILAPCNHLQSDVPPENVVALFEYANKTNPYC